MTACAQDDEVCKVGACAVLSRPQHLDTKDTSCLSGSNPQVSDVEALAPPSASQSSVVSASLGDLFGFSQTGVEGDGDPLEGEDGPSRSPRQASPEPSAEQGRGGTVNEEISADGLAELWECYDDEK